MTEFIKEYFMYSKVSRCKYPLGKLRMCYHYIYHRTFESHDERSNYSRLF